MLQQWHLSFSKCQNLKLSKKVEEEEEKGKH